MDRINDLPDETICHILSFLAIKEAALTSVLSKRWRNLFAFTPNLYLVDGDQVGGGAQSFIDFVDRVLALSGNFPVKNISIKSRKCIYSTHITRWMVGVRKHCVLNLDIDIELVVYGDAVLVPLFTCKTLVELKLSKGFSAMIPDDVSLPSLKTLFLNHIWFYDSDDCAFEKLLSACPVLEELTILDERRKTKKCRRNLSSSTLKKLTIKFTGFVDFGDMTLDTPSLTYLDYSDIALRNYPVVNLESLVEAKLDLKLLYDYNPTNLIKGLSNVEVLELSGKAGEIFWFNREAIPVFINLLRLSFTTGQFNHYDWEVLPILVKRSPNLHTLVIKGPWPGVIYERDYGSSCPVKVLKITHYGGKIGELEGMKLFLEKMPRLELVKVRARARNDQEKSRITRDLLMLPRSSTCNIQIKFCE